jgi:hypothetical protein
MAEDESPPESLSRRAFLRRIGGRRSPDAEQAEDGPNTAAADEGETSGESPEESSSGPEQSLGPDEARRQLDALGVTLMPLSEGEDRLQVQCKRVGKQFGPEEMRLLGPLAARIAWLDLARTAVDDAALEIVAEMPELRRLYLQKTAIEGTGLSFLSALDRLEYLNLFGTKVDDSALDALSAIDSLQTVYLWQTEVSEEGVRELREHRPDLTVEFGDPFFEE